MVSVFGCVSFLLKISFQKGCQLFIVNSANLAEKMRLMLKVLFPCKRDKLTSVKKRLEAVNSNKCPYYMVIKISVSRLWKVISFTVTQDEVIVKMTICNMI